MGSCVALWSQESEECEDGNTDAFDGCDSTCRLEVCGDGIVQPNLNEECDDGNERSNDGCSDGCIIEFCGDGKLQDYAEECDDGNNAIHDGCGVRTDGNGRGRVGMPLSVCDLKWTFGKTFHESKLGCLLA